MYADILILNIGSFIGISGTSAGPLNMGHVCRSQRSWTSVIKLEATARLMP